MKRYLLTLFALTLAFQCNAAEEQAYLSNPQYGEFIEEGNFLKQVSLISFDSEENTEDSELPRTLQNDDGTKVDFSNIDPEMVAIEEEVLEQINEYRASQGLSPLALSRELTEMAREHSYNMAEEIVPFGHDGFLNRARQAFKTIRCSRFAENVAFNQGATDPATTAVKGWLASKGHHRNIVGRYDKTGIGIAQDDEGRIFFTQIFAGGRCGGY